MTVSRLIPLVHPAEVDLSDAAAVSADGLGKGAEGKDRLEQFRHRIEELVHHLLDHVDLAQRIVAQPGDDAYGRLAILAQWRATAAIAMTLPPAAFTPPPSVHSAVVHLTALPAPRFAADPAVLARVTAAAFGQRRKMLRSSLRSLAPDIEDRLRAAGIEPTQRAEEVGVEAFCALARSLAA